MSVYERHYRYLDGESSPEERAQVEAELKASPELARKLERSRQLEHRVTKAHHQEVSAGHRASIWSRFDAAVAADGQNDAPIHSFEDARQTQTRKPKQKPGGFSFDWRFAALPIAAVAAALLMFVSGVFDGAKTEAKDRPWFRESTVVDAVLVSEGDLRSQLTSSPDAKAYQQSVESALATERVFQCFFGQKLVGRELRRDTCQKLLSSCSTNPISIPPFPKEAVIDAFRVYEMELPSGAKLQVPHFLVTHNNRRLSVHLICGSQKQLVEEELRSQNASFEIASSRPTKLCDNYRGCTISLMPKGSHLLMVVSELPPEEQKKLLEQF
ncbi:MAG: hypothetical protein V3W41_04905 [Planctomycetota bacterium]